MKRLSSSTISLYAFALLPPAVAEGRASEQEPPSQAQEEPRGGEAGAAVDEQAGRGATPDAPDEAADFFNGNGGDEDRVREVQRVLQEKAYYTGPIDGIVNAETRSSLRDFQHDYELPITGKVDEKTAERLGIE